MKVVEAFKKNKPALSFEFFPPKTEEQEAHLFEVIAELKRYKPDFVSVTYGAMGNTRGKTIYWVGEIKKRFGIEPVAHLTCVNASRKEISEQIAQLKALGIENVLALRGDLPEGTQGFVAPEGGFKYASELVAFIKHEQPQLCLGAAVYPEGHPENRDLNIEVEYIALKEQSGAEFLITQLFFDNQVYYNLIEKCERAGIRVPIIPGIMPVGSYKSIVNMTVKSGTKLPEKLKENLERHKDDPKGIKEIGAEQAIKQCRELLRPEAGRAAVKGLHFFVLNQVEPIATVLREVAR